MTVIPLGLFSSTALQIQSNETEYETEYEPDELSDDLSDDLSEHSDDELSDEIWRLPGKRDLATSRRARSGDFPASFDDSDTFADKIQRFRRDLTKQMSDELKRTKQEDFSP
ncbi:hypothetical protein Rs2_14868 [Raphanus sativus]|nr:hypothetical protein Rs2_14868 [Raphanus sativus]